MSPALDLLVRVLMAAAFIALVASVACGRRMTDPEAVEHDPRRCPRCAELRHPSAVHTRAVLAAIPRQTRKGDQ